MSNQTNILDKIKAFSNEERDEALRTYESSLDAALEAWKQRSTELLYQATHGDGQVDHDGEFLADARRYEA